MLDILTTSVLLIMTIKC